jgi:hypothetical protein
MKTKTFLLSGIAGLAVASAVSFGAQAQTDTATPATEQAAAQTPVANATGGQTPATAPSVEWTKQRHHRGIYRGQSGPQDSTPAEKAATDLLNRKELAAVQSPAPPASPQPAANPTPPPTQ